MKNKIKVESIDDDKKCAQGKAGHAKLFNNIVLPAMLYASKTWVMNKEKQRLVPIQRAMGRSMLGRSLHEHV